MIVEFLKKRNWYIGLGAGTGIIIGAILGHTALAVALVTVIGFDFNPIAVSIFVFVAIGVVLGHFVKKKPKDE